MQFQVVCQSCGQALLIDNQSTQALQCPSCSAVVYSPIMAPLNPTHSAGMSQDNVHSHNAPSPSNFSSDPPQKEMPNKGIPQKGISEPMASDDLRIKIILFGSVGVVLFGALLYLIMFVAFGKKNRVADKGKDNPTNSKGQGDGAAGEEVSSRNGGNESGVKYPLPTGKPTEYLAELNFVGQRRRDLGEDANGFNDLPDFGNRRNPTMPMEYSWREFGGNEYQFQIQIKKGRHSQSIVGVNKIEEQQIGNQTFSKDRRLFKSSGACFFIHPDGLALTSADLVTYLNKIEVYIDGNWLPAKLIAVDKKSNIALIHVDRKNGSYLQISKSPLIRLAEPLHCGGFRTEGNESEPASVQAGQISGVSEEFEGKEFQFDTKFVSNHVGGPIFNGSGQVMGVTSFVFHLDKLNPVSIGVPSTSVFGMLKDNGLKIPAAKQSVSLDRLRSLSRKAICRLRASGTIKQDTVSYRSSFRSTGALTGPTRSVKGASLLTSSGDVLKTDGGGIVNLFVAQPGYVGVESLSPYGIDYWCNQSIEFVTKNPDFFISRSQLMDIHAPGPGDIDRILDGLATVIRMDEFTKVAANEKYFDYRLKRTIRSLERDENSPRFFDAELVGIVRFDLKNRKVVLVNLVGKMKTKYLSDLSIPIDQNQAHIFHKTGEYDLNYSYVLKKMGTRTYEQPPTVNNEFTVLPRFQRIIAGSFSLNDEFLIGTGKRLKIIDAKSRKLIAQSDESEDSYLSLVHASAKTEFFVRRKNRGLEKWSYNRDGEAFLVAQRSYDSLISFDVSPDDRFVALKTIKKLQILSAKDLSVVVEASNESDRVAGIVGFSNDGKNVVTVVRGYIRTFETKNLNKSRQNYARGVASSPKISSDGKFVIYSDSVNFHLYDVESGNEIYKQRFLKNRIVKVVLCDEPDEIVIIHEETIKRIRLNDFHVVSEIKRPQKGVSVYPAILSKDGSILCYGVDDILHFEHLKH